ncbi:MAG TPA: hypothetical protein VGG48_07930 [Rhizomicrobium sp.]
MSLKDPTLEEELASLGEDDLFDMTNLPSARTGVAGVLFISTAVGQHGPRVKFFEKTGRGQSSFSVSIAEVPSLLANSLPQRVVDQALGDVTSWVALNRIALLEFWNGGQYWTADDVARFIDGLKKI